MARFIEPDEGTIQLDGQDITAYSTQSVRRAIGIVSPDLPLLRGTVRTNLRYRWPDAPEEEIQRVKQLCQLDAVLASLPQGEDTPVKEDGKNLSAGHRQRIALARALLGNPCLLLLDEADANLDADARKVFGHVVATYQGTILLVTHSPDHVQRADAVWHLDKGRLVEVSRGKEKNGAVTHMFGQERRGPQARAIAS